MLLQENNQKWGNLIHYHPNNFPIMVHPEVFCLFVVFLIPLHLNAVEHSQDNLVPIITI